MLLVPRAAGRAEHVHGQAVQLAGLAQVAHCMDRAAEREQDAGELPILELPPQLVKPITQRVPVGVDDHQRQRPFARDSARAREGERDAVDSGGGQEAPPGVRIVSQLVDYEVAPAGVHPADPERGDSQEVVREPVDQLSHGAAETARMMTAYDGGQLALVDQSRRGVEERDEQLAVLWLERSERRAHRVRWTGELLSIIRSS